MSELKKKNFYPAAGWILAGLCLILLLLPAMVGKHSNQIDKIVFAGFSLGAVLTLALAVLNIRFWREKRWVLWMVNGLLLAFAAVSLLPVVAFWVLENGSPADQRAVKELGLSDVSATLEAHYDSHGGFHGDGISMAVYALDEDAAVKQMQTLPGWRKGALDKNTVILSYGSSTEENWQQGPYITDQDRRALVPQKDWVYWYFEDRQAEENSDERYSTNVLNRPSLNFTLALYENSGRLYVFRMDT